MLGLAYPYDVFHTSMYTYTDKSLQGRHLHAYITQSLLPSKLWSNRQSYRQASSPEYTVLTYVPSVLCLKVVEQWRHLEHHYILVMNIGIKAPIWKASILQLITMDKGYPLHETCEHMSQK